MQSFDLSRISPLRYRHLMTLTLEVDSARIATVGDTPQGRRQIAPITGGHFQGERMRGAVLGGADWLLTRPDGMFSIDVRATLKTGDEAMIYIAYRGMFKAAPDVLARFRRREILGADEYVLRTVVQFECGESSLSWLNDVLAIGAGRQAAGGVVYEIYEIL